MNSKIFGLLATKRFLPLFLTQLLEAFNDNLFKNALLILVTFTLTQTQLHPDLWLAICGGLFIFPFFIFSATAGQIADKFDKAILIRLIKGVEILAMLLAASGFWLNNFTILLSALFLLGTHSTFFGPLKYSILPDHLEKNELIAGNALIEASTFIAILVGTILGGEFVTLPVGRDIIAVLGIGIAITGLVCSFFIPRTEPSQPRLTLSLNIVRETFSILAFAKKQRRVFLTILGISWFWFIGATFLTEFPGFVKDQLQASPHVVTLFLSLFSIGIALGSLFAERLQKTKIDARYVPLGVFGMTLFILDLYFSSRHHTGFSWHELTTWRIQVDILFMAICGGLYVVPLYAMMQSLAVPSHRSRIIAANNILNALFMVFAALVTALLLHLHFSVAQIFLTLGIINFIAAIYIAKLLPEAIIKSFVRWILKALFNVKVEGLDHYRDAGNRVVIVANHVSFLDALLLSAFLPDKVMFAINTHIAKIWWVRLLLSFVNTYPLDPTNPMTTKSLIKVIEKNHRCIIFPEGRLTVTGALMKIYEGPAMVADLADATLLPIRIEGAQYSLFSRLRGKLKTRLLPPITLSILPAKKFNVPPTIKGRKRRAIISAKLYDLMTDLMFDSSRYQTTLFASLLEAMQLYGRRHIIADDIHRKPMRYKHLVQGAFTVGRCMARQSTPRENIGVLLPNMATSLICFFALQAYGRIPAMLNYSTGINPLRSACQAANIRTIYTSKQFVGTAKLQNTIDSLIAEGFTIVYLETLKQQLTLTDRLAGLFASYFGTLLYRHNTPDITSTHPAVILFTSGSEGTPKGVVLSHENIQANRFQLAARVDFTAQDIIFNALPIFHSFGLTAGTLLPLLSGIKTFFYPSPLHHRVIPELIYDTNATILFGTDTFLSSYARSAHPYDFYSVRYVFAGAEKLKEPTRKIWSEKFGVRIFEGYGTTETAPILATNTPMQNKVGTVGRLLPKIDYKLEPVPGIAEGGRLIVSGPNIMLGYLYADQPGDLVPPPDGWYDTGDIVTIDDEGYLTIQGRAKRFAKVGGEMVSLTAVENYVADLWPDHSHAALSVQDPQKGECIILVTDYPDAARQDLITHFKGVGFGEIYLPKRILVVDSLPLLATGKPDYVTLQKRVVESV